MRAQSWIALFRHIPPEKQSLFTIITANRDDGVTIEHKVWVRSNGALLRHERFSKTGVLEMRREFDTEGRMVSSEEFKDGKSEVHVYQLRSRGFVPDGLRSYPGGNDKIGYVYDLDGKPFQHSVNDPQSWSFFAKAK